MLKLGCHVSFKAKDYLVGAIKEALSYGANTCMIYLGPPQNAKRIDPSKYGLEDYQRDYQTIIKPSDIIVHAPYIINPSNPEKWMFARDFLIDEIKRMNYIGAKYLVLHPGAYTKFEKELGIKTLINTLKAVIKASENVEILLETMAGKGTEIGTSFKELSEILTAVNSNRINLCFDTCHVWDSGIDIKNTANLIEKINEFNLLPRIKVIHLNDSKNPLGSHKDRHANLDQGQIGLQALKNLIHHPTFANIPIILETPWIDDKPPYQAEIQALKQ